MKKILLFLKNLQICDKILLLIVIFMIFIVLLANSRWTIDILNLIIYKK